MKSAPKQSLSLHILGAEPKKILSSFYSNLQRYQKWEKLLDSLWQWHIMEEERSTDFVEKDSKFQLFILANLSALLTVRYSCHPKINPQLAAETFS